MAAQELEADQAVASVAGTTVEDLASQATAPSHVLDSESLLSQPSVLSSMAVRAPSPSRFIKLPGPARTPPRTPADEYKMFDEFVRAPYVLCCVKFNQ